MFQAFILEPDRYPEKAMALLKSFGNVALNDGQEGLSRNLAQANALVIRLKYKIDKTFLAQAPRLKVIATATTGLDHIDLAAAEGRGITVLSLRGETEFLRTITATAEHTWGLLLALLRHIPAAHQSVVNGNWDRNPFFGRELQSRTLGIVGLGRIGRMVARYGLAFRMRVLAYDPYQTEWVDGVTRIANLGQLASEADVLSIHVPLVKETEGLISKEIFNRMKPGSVLLNTSRGALLDEGALLKALENGCLGGAALDVIHDEYDPSGGLRDRLIRYASTRDNLVITPHLGGATHDSLEKVEVFMAEKLVRHARALPPS